jgi:cold shock CspA family protein
MAVAAQGLVRYYDPHKRLGYIQPNGGGELVFFHERETANHQGIQKGTRVTYSIAVDRTHRPVAVQVRAAR